jgi:hypothetical protein
MSSQSSGRKNTVSEEVEISVVLKLPKGHYQVATGLTRIYIYANFDEYVSETIKENLKFDIILNIKHVMENHYSIQIGGVYREKCSILLCGHADRICLHTDGL